MRSSKSRSRSKANRPRSLGNIINRVFDSSGPEGKVRGTPQQIIEKYLILARDAQLSNDRVAAENFLQHAEHYTRLLSEAQRELAAEQEERQRQHQQGGGQNGGQQGFQNRDRDGWRDRGEGRDFRTEREDEGSGAEVIDLSGQDDNLVETPEARPQHQPRRDEPRGERRDDQRGERRRDDRGERGDRPERREERRDDRGERPERRDDQGNRRRDEGANRPERREDRGDRPERRDERRDDRGERPARRDDRAPEPVIQPVEPTAGQTEAAPSDAPVQAEKPKKPRAPRKPKPDTDGGGSQEAAE